MIHDALRLIRVYHNLKQGQLAERLEISQSHLSEVEAGRKQPTFDLLERYSRVFDMPVSSIVLFSERKGEGVAGKLENYIGQKTIKMLDWVHEITK
jgi:transcriptional regulator with XRE-family HTH domain